MASAVDEDLCGQLRALLGNGTLTLRSVQPYLMAAFNRFRDELRDASCFFLAEPGRLCLGVFAGGEWAGVRSTRLEADASLESAMMRELRRIALPLPRLRQVFVHASHQPALVWKEVEAGLPPPWILGEDPSAGAGYSMALCGAA
jgi:hypothetical protein